MTHSMRALVLATPLLLAVGSAAPLRAQTAADTARARQMAEDRFGQGVTQEELLRQLRASGLSRSQVQMRLQQMGYDPGMADEYFDIMQGRAEQDPGARPDDELLGALRELGVQLRNPLEAVAIMDSLAVDSAMAAAERSRIFGKSLFARASTEFEPVLTGAVSADYPLGPGDEIYLILTGDVEATYPLTVTREGFLIIPEVGQVPVNGLTLQQLEDRLYTYLGRAFSGVQRGPQASTRFQVSLGQLRANHVFVIGEVERPSGYQVSPMARSFNALYRAGGPNEIGSFRRIAVRRDGRKVAEVDLYPYLLAGEAASDVRLQQGDMVFVPVAGPRVTMEGEVRRPGIFEIKEGEGLLDVLGFAGGVRPEAVLDRVQIDRILSPSQRLPGKDRALIDVDVVSLFQEEISIPLEDGDVITLFTVSEERRNRVMITGGVRRPGQYEWTAGMTLAGLVDRADGLTEGAYASRALVYRLQQDRTRRMLRAPLTGEAPRELALADRDSVVVLREDSLRLPRTVTIRGFVKKPGEYPMASGMTVRELILSAGGFAEGAHVGRAEVARPLDNLARANETAQLIQVPLTTGEGAYAPEDGIPEWRPEADEVVLVRGDRVYVRQAPNYTATRTVKVAGEVLAPGQYELDSRHTRISDVITRAGGVTAEAYAEGFSVIREGRPIAGDLTAALHDPEAGGNILLESGDSLHVPSFDRTVNVSGAVLLEAKVLYRDGRSLRAYIDRAGGFAEHADRDRIIVTYPNGERVVVDSFLLFKRDPPVQPGSSIYVAALSPEERQGIDWGSVITQTTAVVGTLATLLIALSR